MKAEPSRLIPPQPAENLELELLVVVNQLHQYDCRASLCHCAKHNLIKNNNNISDKHCSTLIIISANYRIYLQPIFMRRSMPDHLS